MTEKFPEGHTREKAVAHEEPVSYKGMFEKPEEKGAEEKKEEKARIEKLMKDTDAAIRESKLQDAERRMKGEGIGSTPFEKIESALKLLKRDKGFREFFTGYRDAESLDFVKEYEEIKERHERYILKKEAESKLNALYIKEIEKALKIKLSPKDKQVSGDYLAEAARNNPERLKEFLAEIEFNEKLNNEAQRLNKEVDSLGGEDAKKAAIEELKSQGGKLLSQKETAEQFVGLKGFIGAGVTWNPFTWGRVLTNKNAGLLGRLGTFGLAGRRTVEEGELRTHVREMQKKDRIAFFANLDKDVAEFENKVKLYEIVEDRKEAVENFFRERRKEFFKEFEAAKIIWAVATRRAREYLTFLATKGEKELSLKKLKEAEQYLARLHKAEVEFEMPVAANLTEQQFARDLNKKIQTTTFQLMQKIIHDK